MGKSKKGEQTQSQSETQQASNSRLGDEEENEEILHDIEEEEEVEGDQQQQGKRHASARGSRGSKRKQTSRAESEAEEVEKQKQKSTKTSDMWSKFDPVTVEIGEPPIKKDKAKCKSCGTLIAADTSVNGTKGMWNHYEMCQKKRKAKQNQSVLNFQESTDGTEILTTWRFNQFECRIALVEMIILDELPFKFVEREGFRRFTHRLCPQFQIPSRHTIRADCVKMFLEKKIVMKNFFQKKGMGRVSITTDCWTSINNTNFICVTAHCIDKDWILHKKIISFRKICSHRGNDLGVSIISSLEEWGLKRLLGCTMDNASANDVCIRYMKPILETWNTSVAGGKFFHMRCVAHILNLVVHDGLEEMGLSMRRVREACKWIRGSPARIEAFKKTVDVLNHSIGTSKFLCLDVPTRWNSTYLMLESALPYAESIKYFGRMHDDFADDLKEKMYKNQPIGVPEDADWVKVKMMMEYLEKFYDLTVLVSGTSYVTSHHFFKEMCGIFDHIYDLELNDDEEIRNMAKKMKEKLGKYWLEEDELNPKMNKILYVAALLDPRQKMKHVEMCLNGVYGEERAAQLVNEVNNSLNELFEFYKKEMTAVPFVPESRANASTMGLGRGADRRGRGNRFTSLLVVTDEQPDASADASEITLYFTEKQYVMTQEEVVSFDVLDWWRKHGPRFPILSEIARDILAIPISSVASESAFSTGGRVLSQFRSSLTPNMVEALICAEDWLKASPVDIFLKDEEGVPESQLEKEFETVLNTLGMGGQKEKEVAQADESGQTSVA